MGKYGFNENEVRKTIVTKIDKDGFHKEEIFDGNVDGGSSDFTFATMTVVGNNDINMETIEVYEAEYGLPAHIGGHGLITITPGETRTILLYKGAALVPAPPAPETLTLSVDGDAEVIFEGEFIMITGDFSIGYIAN